MRDTRTNEEVQRLRSRVVASEELLEGHEQTTSEQSNSELTALNREIDQKNVELNDQIEEVQRMQDKLVEAERSRVLVQMAGAAAHEINQPLTVILGLTQVLLRTHKNEGPLRVDLQAVYDAGQEIDTIVRKMNRARKYVTKPYVKNVEIIDFRQASGAHE